MSHRSGIRRLGLLLIVCLAPLPAMADAQKDAALIEAAQDGADARIDALLHQHADVNAVDSVGVSALTWAVSRGNMSSVARLLAAHADPNLADVTGVSPLSVAIQNRSPDMASLLLQAGANPKAAQANGETVLMTAARAGQTDIVAALLAKGADVNAKENRFGQTALMWSVGHPEVTKLLLAHGADLRAVTKNWDVSSVIYTPETRTLGVTGIPWNNDGTFTAKSGGLSALMFAVQMRDAEGVKLLLDAGADVNQASADGTTPLLASLYTWHPAGESLTSVDGTAPSLKMTTLAPAPDYGLANLLLSKGAKAGASDRAGYTALHAALVTAVEPALLASGGRGDAEPPATLQLYKKANKDEVTKLVARLLEMGADANQATKFPTPGPVGNIRINPEPPGSTPLHIAAQIPDPGLIEMLIKHGANPNQLRKDGDTPFSVAAASNNLEGLRAMMKGGADINMRYNPSLRVADPVKAVSEARKNETVLHIAAIAGASNVIEYLVSVGAPLNEKNDHGETAYDLANNQELFRWRRRLESVATTKGVAGQAAKPTRSVATTDAFRRAMEHPSKYATR